MQQYAFADITMPVPGTFWQWRAMPHLVFTFPENIGDLPSKDEDLVGSLKFQICHMSSATLEVAAVAVRL